MGKNLVRRIFSRYQTSWIAPAGVTQLTITVLDKFDNLVGDGLSSSYSLKKTGAAFSNGLGTSGELGDNTIVSKSTPIPVSGGHSFIQLKGGNIGCAALKADGSAWCWGSNSNGQLGNNNAAVLAASVPTAVVGLHSFIFISGTMTASSANFCALKADGSVWSWGQGTSGQLADNTIVPKSSPVAAIGGHSFIGISQGGNYALALKANGSVWSWGASSGGQLGDNTTANKSSPVAVVGGHSFIQISCGATHSTALKENGSVWSWGSNTVGQLGDNNADPGGSANQSSPVAVTGGHSFTKISSGSAFTMALKADGSAWGWGTNITGQLGRGNTTPQTVSSPVAVTGGHSFLSISAGLDFVTAVKADGTLWSWGTNSSGQIGDNTIVPKSSPVLVLGGNLFEAGIIYNNRRTLTVVPGTTYTINGFITQIGAESIVSNPGNNVYIVLEYYA